MKKHSRILLSVLPLAVACADDGEAGTNSLISSSNEPAGARCKSGGTKIETGLDKNGNGELDESEVTDTEYVCSGAEGADGTDGTDGTDGEDGVGAEDLTTRVSAATTAQCPTGGQQIEFLNAAGDPTGEPLAICGESVTQSFGSTPVVHVRRDVNDTGVTAGEFQAGTSVVLAATITIPRAGTILAQGSSVAYCSSPGAAAPTYGACATPAGTTTANLTIVQSTATNQLGTSGESVSITSLSQDQDVQIEVGTSFNLAAGTYTFNMLGMASDFTDTVAGTQVYYGASELTLVFIPAAL